MPSFSGKELPFSWSPDIGAGEWIAEVVIYIEQYPTFYSVYRDGRHKPGVHFYWVENGVKIAPYIFVNYQTQKIYAPFGAKPTAIFCASPEHVSLGGEAIIASPGTSDAASAIAERIEAIVEEEIAPMISRIEAKIDALP